MTRILYRASLACATLALAAGLVTAPARATADESKPAAEKREDAKDEAESNDGEKDKTVQTPFGPAAKANRQPPPANDRPVDPMVSVTESGDTVTFTRRTPFGSQTWKRKVGELSDHEKMLLERTRAAAKKAAAPAAEPAAEKPAP